MKTFKIFFWITDLAFILYWTVTALHLIPEEYLYNDYKNPMMVDWNWSFMPLDLMISATGLTSLFFFSKNNSVWKQWALISLVLTFCSGLQAIAFWVLRADYDITWWVMNLYLLIYPMFFIPKFLENRDI